MSTGAMALLLGLLLLSPIVYFPIVKQRAARSLEQFLASFSRATVPVGVVEIPGGGSFHPRDAFAGRFAGGGAVTAVFGGWSRGTVAVHGAAVGVSQRIAGLFVSAPPPGEWIASHRSPGLLLATPIAGGALFLWRGLPTGDSMRRHLREVDESLGKARERLSTR
jgi:hypothetical protein